MAKASRKYSIADFRLALEKVGPSPTLIARELSCATGTVYSYLNRYPELKTKYEALKGGQVEDKPLYPKEIFEKAIALSYGVKASVASAVGCSRQTVDNAFERWPELREKFDSARSSLVSMATSAMINEIQNPKSDGHARAWSFVLKTLGKDEGFVERSEVTGADGRPVIEIPLDLMKQLEATGLDVVTVLRNLAAMPPPMEG